MSMKRLLRGVTSATLALTVLGQVSISRATDLPVDMELVLAVDVSASMDPQKLKLQRNGYVAAFRSPELIAQLKSLPLARIAVSYIEWGDQNMQIIVVPWTLVKDEAGAEAIAAALEAAPLGHAFSTSIAGALIFASKLFDGNGYDGQRKTIDISGDGPNTAGIPVVPARDSVLAHGVTINGLPILIKMGWSSGLYSTVGLDLYYEDCVIGGPGAFVVVVKDPRMFAEAIKRKLILELMSVKQAATIIMPIGDVRRSFRIDCLVGEKGMGRILPLR